MIKASQWCAGETQVAGVSLPAVRHLQTEKTAFLGAALKLTGNVLRSQTGRAAVTGAAIGGMSAPKGESLSGALSGAAMGAGMNVAARGAGQGLTRQLKKIKTNPGVPISGDQSWL